MKTSQVRSEVISEEIAAMRLCESFTDTIRMLNIPTELPIFGNEKPLEVSLISRHFSSFLHYAGAQGEVDTIGKMLDPDTGITEAQAIGNTFYTFLTSHAKSPAIYQSLATSDELNWLTQICFYRAERGILDAKFKSNDVTVFSSHKAMARVYDVFTGKEKYRINTQVVKNQVALAVKETLSAYTNIPDPKTFAENVVNALDFQKINDALHRDTQTRISRYAPILLTLASGEDISNGE
jgi:hypothetical protein